MDTHRIAQRIIALYERPFGGKTRGRFRISMKHLRQLCGMKRLYESDMTALHRALYAHGYAMVDMETYVVVLSHRTFASYRRLNDASVVEVENEE